LSGCKHLPLNTYSSAKKELDKIPLTLAWDLNRRTANTLLQKIQHLGIEIRLLGGLPSSDIISSQTERSRGPLPALYLTTSICALVGLAAWIALRSSSDVSQSITDATLIHSKQESLPTPAPVELPQLSPSQSNRSTEETFPAERSFQRNDVERMLSSTVFIRGEQTIGSGFLISSNGYILSNSHVTQAMQQPIVQFRDGRTFKARKVSEDDRYDISLIKIDGDLFPFLELGDANQVYAGESVITIGNPSGLSFSITRGIVSYNGRIINQTPFLQTDAAINPGNSGGPMINSDLKVIGINTLTATSAQGISFALPINLACDSRGIASSLVPICTSYSMATDRNSQSQVSFSTPSTGPDPYQLSSEDYFSNHQREIKALSEEMDEIKVKQEALQRELSQDPYNNSLRQRVESQNVNLTEKARSIQRRGRESELRYLDQIISLLERQSIDPRYSIVRPQIEKTISETRLQRNQIKVVLDSL